MAASTDIVELRDAVREFVTCPFEKLVVSEIPKFVAERP